MERRELFILVLRTRAFAGAEIGGDAHQALAQAIAHIGEHIGESLA